MNKRKGDEAMKITFNTTQFVNTSGRSPKGWGHWAFAGPEGFNYVATGTFEEAKARTATFARWYFPKAHHVEITVMP
jgi:hypothetical protein